ncbi:metallophosphoesterase [Microbacterium sp. CFBP9034]|uniref:metallophosphoesterase n=1 Tax=Microbacterium sp. CFBP9034 TaxID=3096540 RepID=UPI002A699C54|nr:metallophosphoesterase [Microbacterium sp. CFBP9034]MDY0910784.1 metallophosphoesterase [Microbacterium sp. CFBP9034]
MRKAGRRRTLTAWASAIAVVAGSLLGAPAATAVDETFTIVVLPDTQGYTVSSTYEATMGAQTQWIVDSRASLNTKFVIQVGDLVESWPNVNHWERASRNMKTLDDAGVPNSVLPGNHDLDITTGQSSTFDTYFPPSRYAGASWNSPSVSYGGYLGQNLFGPDEIDRKNKDNFSLLTVGGVDLLILNLEFESPGYSMRWAQKVLDAHPDRKVILATHGFINTGGTRSTHVIRTDVTPTSAVTLWNQFVTKNCAIFMVVNGHWHDGDIGEARRTDANDCGQPVHQILSNYQSRANGGNGWLRYYTFNPGAGTVDAYTYSPSLAQYETDAGSRFTLPVDLTPGQDEVLVAGGSTWKWRNSVQSWPAAWNTVGFDDAPWSAGRAPLGWGAGVTTNIDLAPPTTDRARAMIFRHTVQLDDVDELSQVQVTTRADDGVAVWVNGTLVGSASLQSTTPTSSTYASAVRSTSAATASPTVFTVPASLLREGANTIAASAHVNYRGTADSSFDLVMTARRAESEPPVDPPAAPTVSATALSATSARVDWSAGGGGETTGVEISRGGTTVTASGASGSYVDTGLDPGSSVTYSVVAVGPGGRSTAASATVQLPSPPPPPGAPIVTATATSARSVVISWSPGQGGAVAGVEVTRTGGPTLQGTGSSGSVTDNTAPAGSTLTYSVTALGADGSRSPAATATVTTPPATEPVPVTLVASNASWRFRYEAGAWPTGWTSTAFDAAAWNQGPAPLGFGAGVATVVDVPPGSVRPLSMIFRTGFTVSDPGAHSAITLTVRGDDGVVVYLNGTEVGRLRMPAGSVTATTYATAAPSLAAATASPLVIQVPASLLRAGGNVISASTHLNYRSTPGVSFTATLEAMRQP